MIYNCYYNSLKSLKLKEAGAILVFIFLALILTSAGSSIFAQSNNQEIFISYKNNLLSISAKDADIKEVLLKLSDITNIYVKFPTNLKMKITINKSGISLSEGLKNILKNLDHVIIYSGIENDKHLISSVIVYSETKMSEKLTGGDVQSTSNETQSENRQKEKVYERQIKSYKRQIESYKTKLSEIDKNSSTGKAYSKQIERLEKIIQKLEAQLK